MMQAQATEIDVSVVIPAFNAAPFIDRAIDSALAQTEVRIEVLVVDDACPLGTADAVEARYGRRDEVNVIRLAENGGPSGARNAGFRAARGEWIAVLDADDMFDPGRLARLVDVGRRDRADVVADNVRLFNPARGTLSDGKIRSITQPERIDLHAFVAGARPGTGELDFGLLKPIFRRSFVNSMPHLYPPEIRHGEDFLFYFELLRKGAAFIILPQPGYQWTVRSSGNSQTHADYASMIRDAEKLQALPGVRDDHRLVQLLAERCAALADFERTHRYRQALRQGRYAAALSQGLRHPRLLMRSVQGISRRLVRT